MAWAGQEVRTVMNGDDISELIDVAASEAAVIDEVSRAVRRLEAVQAAQLRLQTLPSELLRQAFAERSLVLRAGISS